MGQSFLTHDEKSSQSPSPDLLQFNAQSHPKFFGSLSSVKETSISSSSRSPLESTDSERNFHVASCSSSSSPRSPPQIVTADSSCSSLVPTPILPGNVHRLREKFMDFEIKRKGSTGEERKINNSVRSKNNNAKEEKAETTAKAPELDCRFISRPATTSPYVSISRSRRRGGTLPSSSAAGATAPRTRSSLHVLSPSSRNSLIRNRVSLPTSSAAYEKLDVIRSDNDLSECFRQMTLATSGNISNFTSETPLVRHRPRARPYVPQPRSVIIRAGYLPVVQTVDVISTRPKWTSSASTGAVATAADLVDSFSPRKKEHDTQNNPNNSNECFITGNNTPKDDNCIKEDLLLVSASASRRKPPKPTLEEHNPTHVVTNQGDHTVEKKVLRKDAEVNTSAEVLVLPKGVKTSVLLKSTLAEVVDGKEGSLRRRKKKRGVTRRVARAFGRLMIRLVELF